MPTSRPHDVRVWNLQDRTNRTTARPWVLRWKVDGSEHSRSYPTHPEADHVRSLLVIAARTGERFDPASGWPAVWLPTSPQRRLHEWIRTWLAEQWPEWQPRTRDHIVDGLARFVPSSTPRAHPPRQLTCAATCTQRSSLQPRSTAAIRVNDGWTAGPHASPS